MGAKVELVECKYCGGCGRVADGEGDHMKCGVCNGRGERDQCAGCGQTLDPVEVEAGCVFCTLTAVAEENRARRALADHQPFTGDEVELTSPGVPADMPSCRRVA